MTIQEFRDYMASGKPVVGGGDVHMMFHQLSQEALKITAEINGVALLSMRALSSVIMSCWQPSTTTLTQPSARV